MLPARRAMLAEALAEMEDPVAVWLEADEGVAAAQDLAQLLTIQPLLALARRAPEANAFLPPDRYPLYRLGPIGDRSQARAGFIGFPEGFMLDAFCDIAVALSRGDRLASALARDTLRHLVRPVDVKVLTSPG